MSSCTHTSCYAKAASLGEPMAKTQTCSSGKQHGMPQKDVIIWALDALPHGVLWTPIKSMHSKQQASEQETVFLNICSCFV